MRVAILVVLVLALAGCGGKSGDAEQGDGDAMGAGQGDGATTGVAPADGRTLDASAAVHSDLLLEDCRGGSVLFDFDGQVADDHLPDSFEPIGSYFAPTGQLLAYGHLLHRECDVMLGNESLGRVAMELALIEVKPPEAWAAPGIPTYALAVHADSGPLVAYLEAQGIPAEQGTLADGSIWPLGWSGVLDTTMPAGRIAAVVPDQPVVAGPAAPDQVFFQRGDNVTRWDFDAQGAGSVVEAVVEPDSMWGALPVGANQYIATFHLDQRMDGHRFTHFKA